MKKTTEKALPYVLLATGLAVGLSTITMPIKNYINALDDAATLKQEALLSLCEGNRLVTDHVLDHSKVHGIPDNELADFQRKNEAMQRTECTVGNATESNELLADILNGSPGQTGEYSQSSNSELRTEAGAFDALGDIEFLAKVGIDDMKKHARTVSAATLRLARDQRALIRQFGRRQGR